MNKILKMICICAAFSSSAHAKYTVRSVSQDQRAAEREIQLTKALALLVQEGVVQFSEDDSIRVDQALIENLRNSGLIKTEEARSASICHEQER